jgi:hypothetical protein
MDVVSYNILQVEISMQDKVVPNATKNMGGGGTAFTIMVHLVF